MSKKDTDEKKLENHLDEDVIIPENQFDPEDRFTTQDLHEIDELLNNSEFLNDYNELEKEENDEAIAEDESQYTEEPGEGVEAALLSDLLPEQEKSLDEVKPEENQVEDTLEAKPEVENQEVVNEEVPEQKVKEAGSEQNQEEINKEDKAKEAISATVGGAAGADRDTKNTSKDPKKKGNKFTDKFKKNLGGKKRPKGLPRRYQKSNWKHTLAIVLGVVGLLALIGGAGVYLVYTANFTDISDTKYTPKEKTYIYTSDNVEIAALYSENRIYVSIEQIPKDLQNALIATEDSRFYTHDGVDYYGVLRALLSNIIGGNSTGQGASTITQQLARLMYLPDISTESTFLDSLNRKFKEISISYQLEDKYTKDQILEMYLNEYFFGSAAYGIEAASETYYGKDVSQLNLAESAMLAGLPQAPSVYAPNVNFEAAKNRQKQVLDRMVDEEYITEQQATDAYNTPITIVPWSENDINNQIAPGYQDYVGRVLDEYVRLTTPNVMKERGLSEDEAASYIRSNVASGGYKFYTTINSNFQNTAINTMEYMLDAYGYSQANGYTGTLVTVDRDGAIRAYYGGNESYSDIDMASSPRQPGSNIKPFYYALAIESGAYNPGTVLNDAPINIAGYSPKNSDNSYMGAITFTQSLVNSRNTTSVQIFHTLGVNSAVDWIKGFGFDSITDNDYNLASALGGFTYGVKPYQMAAAFNTFNNNGVYNQAYFSSKITTSAGDVLLDKGRMGLVSRQVMSPQTASTMWGILNQVVTGGTGTAAQCGIATAGKTGTTDNKENLWFTGMTSGITSSVWLGNLDYHVVGGSSEIPASIYGSYLRNLINNGYIS